MCQLPNWQNLLKYFLILKLSRYHKSDSTSKSEYVIRERWRPEVIKAYSEDGVACAAGVLSSAGLPVPPFFEQGF